MMIMEMMMMILMKREVRIVEMMMM